jgi:hypothetical protein
MSTKVGSITVELDGNAAALEAATSKGAAALLKVSKASNDTAAALLKTSKAQQSAEGNALALAGGLDRLTGKIESLRAKQVALASALANADQATRSNTARMAAMRHELESTTAQLNKFTQQGTRSVQSMQSMTSSVVTTGESLKGMHGAGMKAVGAMSAMSAALSTTDSKVAQLATGLMGIAGAFVAGGPLLGGIALLGTLLGVVVSHFGGIESAAQKAAAAGAEAMARLRQEVDRLAVRLLALQSGASVDVLTAQAGSDAAKAEAASAIAAVGGAGRFERGQADLAAGVARPDLDPAKMAAAQAAVDKFVTMQEILGKTKEVEAEQAKRSLESWLERNRQADEAIRDQAALDAQARRDEAEANRLLARLQVEEDLSKPDRVPFSGLGEVSVEELNAELGITKDVMGDVVYDLDAYNKKLQDQADAARAATEAQRARFEGAAGIAGGALMSGSMGLDTVGAALGMAAGGPMGAAVGSSIAGMAQEVGALVSGGVTKAFGAKGGAVMDAAGAGASIAAAGSASAMVPIIGPFLALAGVVAGVATFFFQLSTSTEAFANIQKVLGMALEVLIDPLGMLWSGLYPVAGAFLQIAFAVVPLLSVIMSLVPLEPIVWVLVEGIKLATLQILGIVAGFAGAAKGLILLLEEATGLNLPGDKALGRVEDAAVAAIRDVEAITVDSGLEAFYDAINDNTDELRTFNDSLTNIPSGYRVPYYDASDPGSHPGSGGGGGVNRGVGRGPKDPSRNSRTGGNISVQQLTIVARDASIFDAIHREAARRFGTNRGIGGGLPDEEN